MLFSLLEVTFFGVNLEQYVLSATLCGIIMLVACAGCIFAATRDSLYEYKGKLIWGAIGLGVLGVIQLLIGMNPEFQRWVIGFLPI